VAQFHFVEDYEKHVATLVAAHPIDEAMALAVGGNYDGVGQIETSILKAAGLRSGMSVFDLGCGSGRLAAALGRERGLDIEYLGTDVVQDLLDYAKSKTPTHFRYARHRELSVPAEDKSIDIACAFSVFTHLLHHESYIYLEDIKRVLKPGGKIVFSFLEFASTSHWNVFEITVNAARTATMPPLNQFIERNAIDVWAKRLGLFIERYVEGGEGVAGAAPLGQCTVILRKE
jgi:ubiquinone/menaquinone biosynthesis C-methylase UbiE